METLRKLVRWNKDGDRDHPSWRKMCKTWYDMVFSYWIGDCGSSSLENKEWNPWKDWCQSWEQFQSSQEMLPKSEKRKAAMFAELSTIAEMTRDRLEEAKNQLEQKTKANEMLRNQNYILHTKCEELQQQLDAAKQTIVENNRNLEKEVTLKRSLEAQKMFMTYRVVQQEEELLEAQTKCKELEEKNSSLQSQLVEICRDPKYQINIKNQIGFFPDNPLRQDHCPQLENGGGQNRLDLGTITYIVDRLGQVNSLNVFDWLCNFEEECKIWDFNANDFEQILRRCMDWGSFTSLPTMVKRYEVNWIDTCRYIAERFVPDIDEMFDTEQMKEDDRVLQYFQRMWMIYRIVESRYDESKDDVEYTKSICEGVLPYIYEEVKHLWDQEYDVIERVALSAERSWLESEENGQIWHMKTRRAGAGCPSRTKIWRKLRNRYHVPYDEIDGAPYWDLVVRLSKYEDLETEE